MQRSEWLQSYEKVHDPGRVAVVGSKVEPSQHRILHLLVAETDILLYLWVLEPDRLCEVPEDFGVGKVKVRGCVVT